MIWSKSPWNESVYTYMLIQQAFIEHLMVVGTMQVLLTEERMSASVLLELIIQLWMNMLIQLDML